MKYVALLLAATAQVALADTGSVTVAPQQQLLSAPHITGSHYSARLLIPAYFDEVGQPVTAERLEAITRRLEELYRRDGFMIPLIVAQQTGATPHLHVFEARVGHVRVKGNAGVYGDVVASAAARLQAQPVLHKEQTQRAIHELEDLPGLSVRADLAARTGEPNVFDLTLAVDFERTDTVVSFTSRVADEIGDGLLFGRVVFNNLLGASERLALSLASSTSPGRYTYGSVRVGRQVKAIDLDLSASLADAHTSADSWYQAQRYTFEASTAAWRRNGIVVRPLVAASVRHARDEDSEAAPWTVTRTRTLAAGVLVTDRRDASASEARITGELGLDRWTARSYRRTGEPADLDFVKAAVELSHSRVLQPGWQLRGALEGQWTADVLPSGERLAYGGAQFGRAFDSGAIIADSGGAVSMQLDRVQRFDQPWLEQGRAWLQADYGVGVDNDADEDATARGASVSVGIAARSRGFTSTVEVGYALQRAGSAYDDAGKVRAFFSTQYAF